MAQSWLLGSLGGNSWGATSAGVMSLAGAAESGTMRGSRHDGVAPIRGDWANTLSQPPAAGWPTTAALGDIIQCNANYPYSGWDVLDPASVAR
jgi:hypothetical protein